MNAFITTGTTMKLTIKRIIYWGVLSLLLISMNTYATQPTHLSPKARAFVNYMVKVHHFNRKKLTALLAQVKYNEEVIFKITHPYEAQPWNVYRAHFLTPERIQQGVLYWQKHATALRYAQQHYGVPTRVIVAIIGVESHYGERTGTYIALNALSTLAFNYPQRSKFFTKELAQFLLLTKEQQLPALSTKSSYAGALGIPQFMPSSYRHYAIDFDGDGVADYLDAELLNQLSPELTSFLINISPLERFNEGLCNSVLDMKNSATSIQQLLHQNIFIEKLDKREGWYCLHPLLANLLSKHHSDNQKIKIHNSL